MEYHEKLLKYAFHSEASEKQISKSSNTISPSINIKTNIQEKEKTSKLDRKEIRDFIRGVPYRVHTPKLKD